VRAGLEGVRGELPPAAFLECDPSLLDEAEASRFGVGALPASLPAALEALAQDDAVHGWLGPQLYDAYVGVKRAEIDAAGEMQLEELCRRYASIY